MKKWCAIVLAGIMLFGTFAVAEEKTVTGTAKGFAGTVTVTLTLDDNGIITNMKIDAPDETEGIADPVFAPEFINKFIGKSTVDDIDTVSGATHTSKAVIEAAGNALKNTSMSTGEVVDELSSLPGALSVPTLMVALFDEYTLEEWYSSEVNRGFFTACAGGDLYLESDLEFNVIDYASFVGYFDNTLLTMFVADNCYRVLFYDLNKPDTMSVIHMSNTNETEAELAMQAFTNGNYYKNSTSTMRLVLSAIVEALQQ